MNSVGQWAHQHDLLLLVLGILACGLACVVRYRRRSIRAWAVWGIVAIIGVLALIPLRTAPVLTSEHTLAGSGTHAHQTYDEPIIMSVEAIEVLLGHGEKPTLVEVYSDFGFS